MQKHQKNWRSDGERTIRFWKKDARDMQQVMVPCGGCNSSRRLSFTTQDNRGVTLLDETMEACTIFCVNCHIYTPGSRKIVNVDN